MSDAAYLLHLGGGLYIDSHGQLVDGKKPEIPVYEATTQLPVDFDKMKAALNDVKNAFNNVPNDRGLRKDLVKFGLGVVDDASAFRFLAILESVGQIASVVAPVMAVAGFVTSVLKLLGVFKDGPTATEQQILQRCEEIKVRMGGFEKILHMKDIRTQRDRIERLTSDVQDRVKQQADKHFTAEELERDRSELIGSYNATVEGFGLLLNQATWLATFDRGEHDTVWPFIQHVLFTHPDKEDEASVPVRYPEDGKPNFDHRLMVPLATFAGFSYLAAVRGIIPEYRTTGDFRGTLRLYAERLEELAQRMKADVLARTIYAPEHFMVRLSASEVLRGKTDDGQGTWVIAPGGVLTFGRWPVGAMDLRYHDDAFFAPTRFIEDGRRGTMDLLWIPSNATLQHHPSPEGTSGMDTFTITNPDECATLANLDSELSYATLLAVSGYFSLVELATLFRHESTEPTVSQTVSAGRPRSRHRELTSEQVVVSNEPSFPGWDPITSTALRVHNECEAVATVSTQPPNRPKRIRYRVWVRTLRHINGDWQDTEYPAFRAPHYVIDDDPAFKRLAVHEDRNLLLDERQIAIDGDREWKSTPRGGILHETGRIEIRADTFDRWVPVDRKLLVDPNFLERRSGQEAAKRAKDGWWPLAIPDQFKGTYHRDLLRETVAFDYALTWKNEHLSFVIKSGPQYRNYVVHFVVEELMGGSSTVLDTAIALSIDGLQTYVPRSHFERETEEDTQVRNMIHQYNTRHPQELLPDPADPVTRGLRPGDLVTKSGIKQFLKRAEQHRPELLSRILAEGRSGPVG